MKKLIAVALLVPSLTLAAWKPEEKGSLLQECTNAILQVNRNADIAKVLAFCSCAVSKMELLCPEFADLEECLTVKDADHALAKSCLPKK